MPVRYVRNELGDVHSVDEDHFLEHLHTTTRGGRALLKAEFEEVDEITARRENPQLFGHPDPDVVRARTAAEIKELRERRQFEKELAEELAAEMAALDAEQEPPVRGKK